MFNIFITDRRYRNHILSFAQKDTLCKVLKALEPYEELTDLLSGDKDVTVSSVAPTLCHLHELQAGCDESATTSVEERNCSGNDAVPPDDGESDDGTSGTSLAISSIRLPIWSYVKSRYELTML